MNKAVKAKLRLIEKREKHFAVVIQKMMFIYGDAEIPHLECQDLVLSMIRQQLIMVWNRAVKAAKESKRKEKVCLVDVIYQFRRHPHLLTRLLRFAKAANHVRSLSTLDSRPVAGRDMSETSSSEAEDETQIASRVPTSRYDEICKAVNFVQGEGSAEQLEKETDTGYDSRQRKMAERIELLDAIQYERFSDARKATFNPPLRKKKSATPHDSLLDWLKLPQSAQSLEFVLGFIARETLANLVEDAQIIREQEPLNYFRDNGNGSGMELRHYEEAIRRNMGYRLKKDILFGYY